MGGDGAGGEGGGAFRHLLKVGAKEVIHLLGDYNPDITAIHKQKLVNEERQEDPADFERAVADISQQPHRSILGKAVNKGLNKLGQPRAMQIGAPPHSGQVDNLSHFLHIHSYFVRFLFQGYRSLKWGEELLKFSWLWSQPVGSFSCAGQNV